MKTYTDQELRQLIIERYTNPQHLGLTNNPEAIFLKLDSPTCSDRLNLEILIKDEKILSLKFNGEACAIAVSATELLIDKVLNKSLNQVWEIIKNYDLLIHHQEGINEEILEELIAFKNIYKQRGRISCATLTSEGIKKIISENNSHS